MAKLMSSLEMLEQQLVARNQMEYDVTARLKNPEHRKDWWVDLFPTHCSLDAADLEDTKDSEASTTLSDIEKEQNVYKRVWLRLKADEYAEALATAKKRHNFFEEMKSQNGHTEHKTDKESTEMIEKGDTIWCREEIVVIRKTIADLKTERASMRSIIRAQAERLEILERKCRSQTKELSKLGAKFEDAKTGNVRFQLLTTAQEASAKHSEEQLSQLENLVKQLKQENCDLKNELETLGKTSQKCRARSVIADRRLNEERESHAEQMSIAVEAARAESRSEIRSLRKAVALAEKATRLEQERHRATRKGLDLLLRHQNHGQREATEREPDLLAAKLQLL